MKWKTFLKYMGLLPSVLFFGILLWLCVSNLGVVVGYLNTSPITNYVDFTGGFEKNLSEYMVQKYDYLELNGAVTRLLGIHDLNDRQLLSSGHLAGYPKAQDQEEAARTIRVLAEFLEEKDVGFLCVPIPTKTYSYAAEFAPGYENDANERLQLLYDQLKELEVPALNMDRWYQEQGWTMEEIYFRTDHHWRPEAAFAAVQQIMEYFSETGDAVYDTGSLDPENWTAKVQENWFLGSDGRRTGKGYSGLDPLIQLYPKYEMQITAGRVCSPGVQEMEFEDTLYDVSYFEKPVGYERNGFCLYLGGDYPFAYFHNTKAVNDQKLVVVGDSYRLPAECFLTTQFSELYHIDMRYYRDGSFAEFVSQIQPDQVVLLFCTPGGKDVLNFGVEAWKEGFEDKSAQTLLKEEEILLTDRDTHLLQANLTPGAYELTLDRALLERPEESGERGPGIFTQFALMDVKTGKQLTSRYFLSNSQEPQKWCFTVPESESANYAVMIYNGSQNYTGGNVSQIQGVELRKYQ